MILNWTEGVEKLWRMSNVFEGYERQYCELSANLSKKCTAATALNGGTLFWFFNGFYSVIDAYWFLIMIMMIFCVWLCNFIQFVISIEYANSKTSDWTQVVNELHWTMNCFGKPSLNNGCNDHPLDFTFLLTELWITIVPFLRNGELRPMKSG